MRVSFVIDHENPCPECDGVRFYPNTKSCYRCSRRRANKKIADKRLSATTCEYKAKYKPLPCEADMMEGVDYG